MKANYGDPAAAARLQKQTADLLRIASSLEEFECRLASSLLSCQRSSALVVDSPFEDVLLDVPVRGDAHVKATLKAKTVPNSGSALFEISLDGTVELDGRGSSHGVNIYSDATTTIHAVKRVALDSDGLRADPSTAQVRTSFKTKGIQSNNPRLLGRITERVARRRVAESRQEAAAECSEHVREAICAVFDREVDVLVAAVNRSLADHLAASEQNRIHWRQIRFATDAESLSIARRPLGKPSLVAWSAPANQPQPAIVLRIPRADLKLSQMLASVGVLAPSAISKSSQPKSVSTLAAADQLRPTMNWQTDSLTLSFHLEPAARLAQEPSLGAAQ